MRLLLDTNVVIALEDPTSQLIHAAAELSRLAQSHGVALSVHPGSRLDFERDSDEQRRYASITASGKYPEIATPPPATEEFIALAGGIRNANDQVDLDLLYALSRDCASFLVTEDRRLHRCAHRVGLGQRVYYVEQASATLTALFEPRTALPPLVEEEFLYSLDLDDAIFGSLRSGYPEFDDWFREKAAEHRKAWVIQSEGELDAICIFKLEDPERTRTLKLCTFKVGEDSRGRHLGELLLKTAFGHCTLNGYSNAYVEVLPEQGFLIDFLEEFGFEQDGLKPGTTVGERIYRKKFVPVPVATGDPVDFHVRWAPAVSLDVRKFFVPIQPEFHDQLFPDAPAIEDNPAQLAFEIEPVASGSVVGNGIRKAYLSNASTNQLSPGDLLVFYRSHDAHAITTLGIVEDVMRSTDPGEVAGFVGKRTVYSYEDIESKATNSILSILFRQVAHLPTALGLPEWRSLGGDAYRSITEINETQFERIWEMLNADPA